MLGQLGYICIYLGSVCVYTYIFKQRVKDKESKQEGKPFFHKR